MFTKSIRWRIQLWLAFLLACVLTGFGATVYQLYRLSYFDQLDEELARRVSSLNQDIRPGPRPGGPPRKPALFDDREGHPFPDGSERGGAGRGPDHRGGRGDGPEFDRRGVRPPFEEMRDGPRPRGDGSLRELRDGPFGRDGGAHRPIRLSAATIAMFDESQTNGFYFALWSRAGTPMRLSSNAPAVIWPGPPRKDTQPHTFMRDVFREMYQFTEFGECVLVGRWIGDDLTRMKRFTWLIVGAGLAVLALGLGGSWSLARQAVRPVEEISATAGRISAGNLAERINVAETDGELGRLAGVLNSTFARLETAFAQQKQFTADASHELRTPLAVMISEAQTTLARPRDAAEYRQTVETCLQTAQEMRRLTESMLQLARLDAPDQQIAREPVNLVDVVQRALGLVRTLAEDREIRISSELTSALTVGDAGLLTQVITNLLYNAIHYNKPAGEIHVHTLEDDDFAVVAVSDTGVGISTEDLPHIFDRFYRGDKARSNPGGRMGLGLAICKTIIALHGGAIEVSSELGRGTVFTVSLPLAKSERP